MTADSLKEHKENIHIPYFFDSDMRLLKSVAIYGHNSHGKSNFIRAYHFFTNFIFTSFTFGKTDNIIEVENFKLNTSTQNQPSYFEIIFLLKEIKYRYGFEITSKKVVSEWLFYAEPKIRENYLFIRSDQETKISKNWNKIAENRIEQAILFTKSTNLLLSVLISQENIPRIESISTWLSGNIIVTDTSAKEDLNKATLILLHTHYRSLVFKFLENADLGFVTIKEKIDNESNKRLSLDKELLNIWYAPELKYFELYTQHEIYDETYKKIETTFFELLKNESSGTIKYFTIACYLAYAIKQGQLILIDELDSKFHFLLLQFLIKTFNSSSINTLGSQMIFTTHNTILLNNKFFRRDQFMLVEKNEFGESILKRIHTAKTPVRGDILIEKEYTKGNIGGISKKLKPGDEQSSFDFD